MRLDDTSTTHSYDLNKTEGSKTFGSRLQEATNGVTIPSPSEGRAVGGNVEVPQDVLEERERVLEKRGKTVIDRPVRDIPDDRTGNILGGATAAGTVVDEVAGDFTRGDGAAPVSEINVRYLGTTSDGLAQIEVSQTNSSRDDGIFLTPGFVGVHDGSFDVIQLGQAAPEYLERLAEDGVTDPIMAAFDRSTGCLLYTSPSPRDRTRSRMPSSA